MQFTSAKTLVDVQGGLVFATNPHWFDGQLLFLDIHDGCLKSTDLTGVVRVVTALPFLPGSFEVMVDGGLVVGDATRRKLFYCNAAGQSQMADLGSMIKTWIGGSVRDNRGGMYVDDIGFDFLDPSVDPVPGGLIAYINADGACSLVASDLFSPHGMIITPDNKILIVAETYGHCLTAFDIEDDGSLQNRRTWAQLKNDEWPVGICLDIEGAVWTAGSSKRALRVKQGGEVDHLATTKRPVYDLAVGGPERKHLFMCTSASNDPVITRRNPAASIEVAILHP